MQRRLVGKPRTIKEALQIPSIRRNLGFWRLNDKIGMPLDEIHTSGNVPQCEWLLHSFHVRLLTCCLSQGKTRDEHGAVLQTPDSR